MRGRSRVDAFRVAATPTSLDEAVWPSESLVLRTAADEVLVIGSDAPTVSDPHAVVIDDTGWERFEISAIEGPSVMAHLAAWPAPSEGFAQGAMAGVPAKVVVGPDRWLIVVASAMADDFAVRLQPILEAGQ